MANLDFKSGWLRRFMASALCTWVIVGFFYMTSTPRGGIDIAAVSVMLVVCLAVAAISGGISATIFRKNDLVMVVVSQVIAIAIISTLANR